MNFFNQVKKIREKGSTQSSRAGLDRLFLFDIQKRNWVSPRDTNLPKYNTNCQNNYVYKLMIQYTNHSIVKHFMVPIGNPVKWHVFGNEPKFGKCWSRETHYSVGAVVIRLVMKLFTDRTLTTTVDMTYCQRCLSF